MSSRNNSAFLLEKVNFLHFLQKHPPLLANFDLSVGCAKRNGNHKPSPAGKVAGECLTDEESIARIVFAIVLGVILAKPFVTKIFNATAE